MSDGAEDLPATWLDTPMDHDPRKAEVHAPTAWRDGSIPFVDVDVEIDAVQPVTLTVSPETARDLGCALLAAAGEAEELVASYDANCGDTEVGDV